MIAIDTTSCAIIPNFLCCILFIKFPFFSIS